MSACEMCERPNLDTAFVCHACAQTHARLLHTQATNYEELDTQLARLARYDNQPQHRNGITEYPLPYDPNTAHNTATINNTLTAWSIHISWHRGLEPPRAGRHLLVWLGGQCDWLRYRTEGGQALDELGYAARLIEYTVDRPTPRWFAGRCDIDGCPEELYPRAGADTVTCPACGYIHSTAVLRDSLLRRADNVLGTATEIARFVSTMRGELVTSAQVRGLAHRGRIIPHGQDRLARPTYRVGDVLAVIR